MSALEDFAAASRAIGRLTTFAKAPDDAGFEAAWSDLAARYPQAAGDVPKPGSSNPAAYLDALARTGARIAEALAPYLARHGQERYRQGRYRDAVGALRLCLAVTPAAPAANALLASALELAKARTGTLAQARRAVMLAPLDPHPRMLAARGHFAARDHGEAERQARLHLLLAPEARGGWFTLARAQFRGGRAEAALPCLNRAGVLGPPDLDIQRALARCLFRLGHFTEALAAIETAGTLGAAGPDHLFEQARFARSAGRLDLATRLLDDLLAAAPEHAFKRHVLELTATTDDLLTSRSHEPPNHQPRRPRVSGDLPKDAPHQTPPHTAKDKEVPACARTTTDGPGRAPLHLLVEETSRELASRVLIAVMAAARGRTSYIIPQWFAWEHLGALPPGVMLFKGHNRAQAGPMRRAREHGHRVAAIEEEILGVTRADQILRVFDHGAVEACEMFLLQGAHARDVLLSRHPGIDDRIKITGNPRTDALLPPLDGQIRRGAEAVRARHGDFILINTNFGSTNPRMEDTVSDFETCARVGLIDPENPVDRADYLGWCGWERLNMALLAEVIAAARSRPGIPPIIIRPHPSENIQRWREAYPGDDRVRIIREGEHTAWTAAARLLLHTGCTTGVEASLLGTPALSLQGGRSDWHRAHTSNFVNPTAGSVPEALDWIEAVLAGDTVTGAPTPEMRAELERQLLPRDDGLAAERIVEALETLEVDGPASPEDRERAETSLARHALLASAYKIETDVFSARAIEEQVDRLSDALGVPKPPRVLAIGDAMIRISPA